MFKKTLIASAVTAVFALTSQGVQANPITDLVSGFVKDAATVQFDARRGGSRSFSRSSAPKRSVSSTRTAQKRPVADTKAPAQNNAATAQRPGQQNTPNAPQAAPTGGMGMGGSFISSLAGAGAGVLLANMLLSPTAAASQGTEVATPDMLSDAQIDECLAQIKLDIEDAKARLAEAAPEDQNAIRDELSKMSELQITLLNEQINRIQKG
ncbi:MAG: hypothetical protein Q4A68_02505 [Anaerobiospirillum succiniciproducens]|uniref:hypothetical protein n=1 Tax=Anaerobiospirillum succiniciproducens TaxID=13335 RepID=UPI0026DD3DFC|nr:hypothetical protein [Anaerobiospirillum succiniciproducens]MDO4675442.1 hypothetical protein [Anaerobiospirillum succiniciproducens]